MRSIHIYNNTTSLAQENRNDQKYQNSAENSATI